MYDYEQEGNVEFIDLALHESSHKELNVIDESLELFLQEIELAIKIGPGEIWGISDNININKYVFNKYITLSQVKNEISLFIEKNCACANRFPWSVDAQFLNIDGNKMLYIVVTVTRMNNESVPEDFVAKFLLGT